MVKYYKKKYKKKTFKRKSYRNKKYIKKTKYVTKRIFKKALMNRPTPEVKKVEGAELFLSRLSGESYLWYAVGTPTDYNGLFINMSPNLYSINTDPDIFSPMSLVTGNG